MPSTRDGLDRFCAALERSDYRLLRREGDFPCEIEVFDPEQGRTLRLLIYLKILHEGGHGGEESSMRIRLPRRALFRRREEGRSILVLGYEPELDVFAGWPSEEVGGPLVARRLWVPRRSLYEAIEYPTVGQGRGSRVFAFSSWAVRDYLETLLPSSIAQGVDQAFETYPAFEVDIGDISGASPEQVEASVGDDELGPEMEEVLPVEPEEEAAGAEGADRGAKLIETGFAHSDRPGHPLDPQEPLGVGSDYLYWFGVGTETGASIDAAPVPIPEGIPEHARLAVQLFAFDGEVELTGPTRGEIEILADGSARVAVPALRASDDQELLERFLLFPIRTPERAGLHRLRCNLYYGSTLLQSRLISARVGGKLDPERKAISADLDYSMSAGIDLASLSQLPAHELSLMVNGGGGAPVAQASHNFRFYRDRDEGGPLALEASLTTAKIESAIRSVRGALRKASWGSEEEWDKDGAYRYETVPADPAEFARDLRTMAIAGRRLFNDITGELSGSVEAKGELLAEMSHPGRIQIATASSGLYVPAALFYDHPLETSPAEANLDNFRVCEQFLAALQDPAALETCACMSEGCPHREERYVICPSGFWGYRHQIGWPVGSEEPRTEVALSGDPLLTVGVSTDQDLERRVDHVALVMAMGRGELAESREEFRDLVKAGSAHLVYLYCHGGVSVRDGTPYLVLGPPDSDGLDTTYLMDEKIVWGEPPPRPVVFINGCHTTALGPDQLMDLVGGFVERANALGVLGTEVTVFEPLACAFAEQMLGEFLDGGMSIGAAVRRARLGLLRAHNPLGLVYVPFIAADTRLVPEV